MTDYSKHIRFILIVFYIALGFALLIFVLPRAMSLLLPFILGFLLALLSRPLTRLIHNHTRMPIKFAALVSLLAVLCIVVGLVYLAVNRLVYEFNNLVQNLPEYLDSMQNSADMMQERFADIYNTLPISITDVIDDALLKLGDSISSMVPVVTQWTLTRAGAAATKMPQALLFVLTFILSGYFITADYERIARFIKKNLPDGVVRVSKQIKDYAVTAIWRYVRGLGIIMCVMFCVLFVAFLILRIRYALLLAIAIALFDALPILGMGMILIPWGIISIILGEWTVGLYLCLLYVLVVVIRQVIEPKIMSQSLGLHPVLTLAGMYIGLRLFGFAGLVGVPVTLITLIFLNRSGIIHLWNE